MRTVSRDGNCVDAAAPLASRRFARRLLCGATLQCCNSEEKDECGGYTPQSEG